MKLLLYTFTLLLCVVPALNAQDKKQDPPKDKTSYSVGASIGKQLKTQGFSLDIESVVEGLRDSWGGKGMKMPDQEIADTMKSFQKMAQTLAMENAKKAADKTKKDGEDFLAANKKKPGVITLPDGLQYKVITEGKGKKPTMEDTVTVNYRGTFIDGTEFDSSVKHGKASSFPLDHVVKGWAEGLTLMSPGAKYELYIPSELGWAERGMQGAIPPNATVIFEVELVSFR